MFNFLLSSMLLLYFLVCIIDFSFIKLRLFFTPYFFIIFILCNLFSLEFFSINYSNFIYNSLLSTHIILSLLAYSFLTISAFSSLSIFAIEKKLKKISYRKSLLYDLLPSIYESEKITIKLLYLTQIFLLLSLITGFFYSKELGNNKNFFIDEKSIISIFSFFIICVLLFIRFFFGITGKKVFNIVLLSYFSINIAYFGIKLIG
mgnify:CR=1 FL=1